MSGTASDSKEEIRRRIDIAAFVGEYVVLKKAGRNLLGLCPFHREKTPSFTVSPEKQMFYCYGCGEGGDVFSFLMKLNQLTFAEALKELAKRAGVILPQKTLSPEEREQGLLRERIRQANELAAGFYAGQLQAPAGAPARDYLERRGIGPEAIAAFRLGYAPNEWQRLADFLQKKGVSAQVAEAAGLLVPREGQGRGHYDRFRGRLMIPIEDLDGRVIAFGGRILGPGEPKYLNSPESAIYTKGNHLYGLARTREAIRERGFAILVEGYFDLISLWNAGIANVVAPLGTALTRTQVDLLRRYTEHVAALFDPDAAGRKALARSLELFLAGNIHGRAVILPDGLDPDDFVRSQGREKMEALIARALPLADYYIDQILGGRGTLEEERDKLREAVAFLGRIEDGVERNLFTKKVAEALAVDEGVLKREVGRGGSPGTGRTAAPMPRPAGRDPLALDPLELSLIRMVLDHPEKAGALEAAAVLEDFKTESLKALGEAIVATGQGAARDAAYFLEALEGPLRERLLALLVQESPYPEALIDRLIADGIAKLRERSFRERERLLTKRIREAEKAKDQETHERLIQEKNRLLMEKKRFA